MNVWTAAAKKYTQHDMISTYTTLPDFPELRTNVLNAFLRHAAYASNEPRQQEVISMAVSLMQHGLDTHELVDGASEARKRQMTVLAGDYFSSRFYQLLSQAGSVQAIQLLSQAVCDVNGLKITLYAKARQFILTAEEYLRCTVEINTKLFESFTLWMDGVYRKTCPAVLRTIAECELLAIELTRIQPDHMKDSWAYWYVMNNGTTDEVELLRKGKLDEGKLHSIQIKYNLSGILTEMWEAKLEELTVLLRTVGSEKLSEELERLSAPLFAFRKTARAQEI